MLLFYTQLSKIALVNFEILRDRILQNNHNARGDEMIGVDGVENKL